MLCLLLAVVTASVASPPPKLIEFFSDDFVGRCVFGLGVYVALYLVLITLGLASGRVSLPLGLGVEAKNDNAAPAPDAAVIHTYLRPLRESQESIFERLGALSRLAVMVAERVDELEKEQSAAQQEIVGTKRLAQGLDQSLREAEQRIVEQSTRIDSLAERRSGDNSGTKLESQ